VSQTDVKRRLAGSGPSLTLSPGLQAATGMFNH